MRKPKPRLASVNPFKTRLDNSYLEYVVNLQEWHGGLAMGHLWTRLVCHLSPEGPEATDLAGTSNFAETLASFSTISQEKRHENLPSWSVPGGRGGVDGRLFEEESVREMWTTSHGLLMACLRPHPQFPRVEKFLTLEQFLLHLGIPNSRMTLTSGMYNTNNLNGGLFLLHSHLNHSCAPNARVINVRRRAAELTGTLLIMCGH